MISSTSVLCPIDFSEGSQSALRYAGVIAAHFGARVTVLTVNDPLLTEAAELAGGGVRLRGDTIREMERFCQQALDGAPQPFRDLQFEVASGKPAPEILRVARQSGCDLIVMASHGSTGFRKLFFGSTTERVLRETTVPMLVTPASDRGPAKLDDLKGTIRRVLVPVDLIGSTSDHQGIGQQVAEALTVPLLLLHVIEPVRAIPSPQAALPHVETERRYRVEEALQQAAAAMPSPARCEALIAYGEPAEEIAKVANDRGAGLIVMGQQSSPVGGPRMGSVTYRVLCLARSLVLTIPPMPHAVEQRQRRFEGQAVHD
jgi:nucleotide-binding universal stress UspA family protein